MLNNLKTKFMKPGIRKKILIAVAVIVVAGGGMFFLLKMVRAEPIKVRHEINIIDTEITSASSSAMVLLDTAQYSGNKTYYFEIVGQVSSGTCTVTLRREGTATDDASISLTETSYTRKRSTSFTPPAGQTEYLVYLSGGTSPSVIAARIIIIQEDTFTSTETQVEIGNYETGKTNTSTSSLTYPKYWYYDSANWDGTVTFYAEATWKKTDTGSAWATTTDASSGSWDCPVGTITAVVECWGAGGGGGGGYSGLNGDGGGGGAGGQYVKKEITSPSSGSHPYVVGGGGGGGAVDAAGTRGASTTFDTNVVIAVGGAGGPAGVSGGAPSGATGSTDGYVGDMVYRGGNGGAGTGDSSGGGGGGAGTGGNGGDTTDSTAGTGTAEGGGNGGAGVTGNNVSGNPGSNYGGAGSGGTGKGGSGASGAGGYIRISYESLDTSPQINIVVQEDDGSFGSWTDKVYIVSGTTTSGTIVRARSSSFSPTSGRNYRIVTRISNSTNSNYDIYNAKIIVRQADSPTKFEPQYLLANTNQASTGLRNFDTYWDPDNDWGHAYLSSFHEINSSADSGDSAKLQSDPNGTPADVPSSTATGANRARSSEMTMPTSAETLDTNVLDAPIYASRVIVAAVVGAPPSIESFSAHPSTVNTSDEITFDADWTDDEDSTVKLAVCKTDAVSTSTCTCVGDTWCTNSGDTSDPISCSYEVQLTDPTTNDYYAFVCDDHPSASTSTYGTFTVNHRPTIGLADDHPDPVNNDDDITFDITWEDDDAENIKMYICKSDEIATSTESASCPGTSWCSNEDDWDPASPISCSYTAQAGDDETTNNYYAFVCDDQVSCSTSTPGSFAVNHKPTIDDINDHPDPVNNDDPITFDLTWTDNDSGDTSVKIAICKTDEVATSSQTCVGDTWCASSGWDSNDPASCTYTAQDGDNETTNTYYAFVCDDQPSCSTSTSGSFAVNHKPTIDDIDDHPDPVNDGDPITFDADWTDNDSGDTSVKIVVCKDDDVATSTQTCVGDEWCKSSGWDSNNPASCTYTAQVGDQASNDYYTFICDDQPSCSTSTSGTFAVNHKPTISLVEDNSPVAAGENAQFDVSWADTDTEGVNTYICKTNEISTTTPGCVGGEWCSTSGYGGSSPQTCYYSTDAEDEGSNNYWAFVCDDQVSCSGSTSGSFDVQIFGSPYSLEGILKFMGNIKFSP